MTNQRDCCSTEAVTGRQGIAQAPLDRMRSWATSRQGVIVIGLAAVALALGFSWNWLVAIGAASLILSFAPRAVMCALGICMMGRGKSSGTTQDASDVTGRQTSQIWSKSFRLGKSHRRTEFQGTPRLWSPEWYSLATAGPQVRSIGLSIEAHAS